MSSPVASTEFEQAHLAERTRPWQPDELCIVNGMPMAYGFAGSVLVVRLPGGRTGTVAELRALGYIVTLPARIRRSDA